MARRTIQSPGVEIRESDLSLRTAQTGTTTYIAGFASEGPTDEVIGLGNISEFEQIYGTPKTPAERYFYHTARAALNSSGSLLVNRLPYGGGNGAGFGTKLGVLAYPALVADASNGGALSAKFSEPSHPVYILGKPQLYEVTPEEYRQIKSGELFEWGWSDRVTDPAKWKSLAALSGAAVLVFNKGQSTIDNQFNGYYIGVGDNSNINPARNFDAIVEAFTVTTSAAAINAGAPFTKIPTSRFEFQLSATPEDGTNPATNSISQVLEDRIVGYDITTREFDDSLNIGVFKLGPSTFSKESGNLNYLLEEGYNGSIGAFRQRNSENGGSPINYSLDTIEDQSRNIDVVVNPYISDRFSGVDLNPDGTPKAKIRVYTTSLSGALISQTLGSNTDDSTATVAVSGVVPSVGLPENFFFLQNNNGTGAAITAGAFEIGTVYTITSVGNTDFQAIGASADTIGVTFTATGAGSGTGTATENVGAGFRGNVTTTFNLSTIGLAESLVPIGTHEPTGTLSAKDLGSIPLKLDRAFNRVRNDRKFDIDIMAEGGLGTIHTYQQTATGVDASTFDDTKTTLPIEALRTSNDPTDETARTAYTTIFNRFATFAGPVKDGGRGDVLFIADPIRQLLVSGKNSKIQKDPNRNFYTDIYWPMRHQFSLANTSYATVYANWMSVYDNYTGLQTYVPSSGFAAAKMASTDAAVGPWGAPAGFNRGIVTDASDIAITPNQRQRDDLYTVNLNPIANFADQGNVIFGQKTLLKKPSAFDRINVRRTFLYLEKITKKTMQFFLFENNTLFTRTRVINTLTPFFERVKADDGLYDFMLVCDDRNNTPEVIDQNELVVDIYLKPVRTAEFILVNFSALRTGTNFEEIVSN